MNNLQFWIQTMRGEANRVRLNPSLGSRNLHFIRGVVYALNSQLFINGEINCLDWMRVENESNFLGWSYASV